VAVARERVQYLNAQGKLITESLRDYTRINLTRRFDSLDKFLQAWNDADRKAALLEELEGQGVLIDALADEVGRLTSTRSTCCCTWPTTCRRSPGASAPAA
jgi:type I restriction enzyme R subunit